MRDNDLIRLFMPIIEAGLTSAGFLGVTVLQANQPTLQGTPSEPTVFFQKISDRRYGFLKREDEWDEEEDSVIHRETQLYETTFQVSALVFQNPGNPVDYTASDLVNAVAMILQSDATSQTLSIDSVGILRITDVRNPYFIDDRDQFEASPSFDFILTHRQISETLEAHIDHVDYDIKRV